MEIPGSGTGECVSIAATVSVQGLTLKGLNISRYTTNLNGVACINYPKLVFYLI